MKLSGAKRSAKVTLIVVLVAVSFLAVAAVSANFFTWLLEGNGKAGGRSMPVTSTVTEMPEPAATAPMRRSTPTLVRTPEPTPSGTTDPARAPVPAVDARAPEVLPTAQAPMPARVPTPVKRECPSGAVTSTLLSVTIDVEKSSSSLNKTTVTAHGTLTNQTSAPVGFLEFDIPNFQGLNVRGQPVVIELYGTYDWTPPPGVPSGGEIHLQPGQTIGWSAVSDTWDTTVHEVTHWYAAAEPGSILTFFGGRDVVCAPGAMAPGTGNAIPNTARSTS